MSKPSLHEVLKRHRPKSHDSKKPEEKKKSVEPAGHAHVKHTVLEAKDAKALFFDLPKEHKFWLVDGKEINNLTELYKSLVEMPDDVFKHHVRGHKNDFAKWVEEILGDTVLARKLRASNARIDQVDAVKERIERIRSQGRRIPCPYSNLNPDYTFIRVEKARKAVPKPTMGLEHKFKIRGKSLDPDASFITGTHHDPHGDVTSKYEDIIDSQRATIRALENEVKERRFSEEDLQELIGNYKTVYQQVADIQNQLRELGREAEQGGRDDEHQKKELERLRDLIQRLRGKEREMLSEIKQVSKTEDKINAKTSELMEKEKEIAKKEGLLLRKQGQFNSLRSQYDEKLKKMSHGHTKHESQARHEKHSPPRPARKDERHHGIPKKKPHVPAVHIHAERHKAPAVAKHEGKPHPKKPGIRERLRLKVLEPKKEQVTVTDMLESTVVGKDDSHDSVVVEGLLGSARHELAKSRFESARKDLDEAKVIVSDSGMDPEKKKGLLYRLFELETEIDLNAK